MTHPQSTAQELAKSFPELPHIQNIAKYGCAAFTAMWSFGVKGQGRRGVVQGGDSVC